MATATWPGTLPQKPLQEGWSWTPQDNKASFKPDVGPAIERRRSSAVVYDYTATFPAFTDTQVATFETWYHDTLKSGALHYLWGDPVSGTNYKWKIGGYTFNSSGPNHHRVTLKLRRLPGAAV